MVINSINNVNKAVNCVGAGSLAKCQQAVLGTVSNNVSFKGNTARITAIEKFLTAISEKFSSPHQRAILGVTALCTQPFIDLHNRHIKKEDKPITVARTIAKIIVGTAVGVALRHYSIKAIKNYTNAVNCGKYSQCLLPKSVVAQLNVNPNAVDPAYLTNYRNGLGTFIGVMGGLFTNFFVDAPLSKKLTNLIHDKVFKKENAHAK